MVYDIVFIGYDSDVGPPNSEKLGLLVMDDLFEGYSFGLVNKVRNDDKWESFGTQEEVKVSFKIKDGETLKKGTLLEIYNLNGVISVKSDNVDISSFFNIDETKGTRKEFISTTGSYLTVYSGFYIPEPNDILMGTVLDVMAIGVSRSTVDNLQLPKSLTTKDILVTDNHSHGGGHVDIANCRLCDILLIVLDPANWILINDLALDNVDLSDFNLDDCAETDCEGSLSLQVTDCTISILSNPCTTAVESYEWQIFIDGVYYTVDQGQGPNVDPYTVVEDQGINQKYRLIVKCVDGCNYSAETIINCTPLECEAILMVDTTGCILTATVSGCSTPNFQWYVLGDDGAVSQAGNSSQITANVNGSYYVVVTGCPGCDLLVSDYYKMEGCVDCNCSQSGSTEDCLITFSENGCLGYTDKWYFGTSINGPWEIINFHGTQYTASTNGFYRRVLVKDGCPIEEDIVFVENCNIDCNEFTVDYIINQSCQFEISYSGCLEVTDVEISYAVNGTSSNCDESLLYQPGGGFVIDNQNNGLNGLITIEPEFDNTCYQITLICSDGCIIELYIWNGVCCQGDLTIEQGDSCIINTINVPCTGTFDYYWIVNGVQQSTMTGTSVPPYIPTENGTHILEVICADGCMFPSNSLEINCIVPECESSVVIEPEDCILTAEITNCPNGSIQWQIDEGNGFMDIPDANSMTYTATEDLPYKVIISGCDNCENEEISFEYTPMGCDDMCDCETEVTLDEVDCILNSEDDMCMDMIFVSWWQSNDGGNTFFNLPETKDMPSIIPPENATYMKLIEFNNGCPNVSDTIDVDCLEDCGVEIELSITPDCKLKASWEGCSDYNMSNFGWYWANSTNCPNQSNFPLTQPKIDGASIIEFETNPAQGTGHIIIDPEFGDGCYFFNFQCNGCNTIQNAIEIEDCCPEEDIYISEVYNEEELCTYCWYNEGDQEILDIDVVLPDGSVLDLSTLTNDFTFPYCEGSSCSTPQTIQDLINDINTWLDSNGYLGTALPGPDGLACKTNGLFHIANTNIEFIEGTAVETNGTSTVPFITSESECIFEYSVTLTVENECDGATYLWSNGDTTETIIVPEGTWLDVTVTCPDGCSYTTSYFIPIIQPMVPNDPIEAIELHTNLDETASSIGKEREKPDLVIYPNPTRDRFTLETKVNSKKDVRVKIFSIQGKMIKDTFLKYDANNTYSISTQDLHPGIYLISASVDEHIIGIEKLIIIK